jgi:uncharacterized protein
MFIRKFLHKNVDAFKTLCLEHDLKYMYAFGSATNDTFDEQSSDIDLVVELNESDPVERGEKLLSLWDKLELIFNRKVDLITETSIHNPYLKQNIERHKILIYDGTRAEILI